MHKMRMGRIYTPISMPTKTKDSLHNMIIGSILGSPGFLETTTRAPYFLTTECLVQCNFGIVNEVLEGWVRAFR